MRRTGSIILGGSLALAALLIILWLAGAILGIGGSLIHLLLVLALLVGTVGTLLGMVLLLAGKRDPSSASPPPPQP